MGQGQTILSVQLDEELERALSAYCNARGDIARSVAVRELLQHVLDQPTPQATEARWHEGYVAAAEAVREACMRALTDLPELPIRGL